MRKTGYPVNFISY